MTSDSEKRLNNSLSRFLLIVPPPPPRPRSSPVWRVGGGYWSYLGYNDIGHPVNMLIIVAALAWIRSIVTIGCSGSHEGLLPSKRETLKQRCLNVGPGSATLALH